MSCHKKSIPCPLVVTYALVCKWAATETLANVLVDKSAESQAMANHGGISQTTAKLGDSKRKLLMRSDRSLRNSGRNEHRERDGVEESAGRQQFVHWVFTTDCSAYMFNQGNLMLASAHAVNQSGEFTWITYGCTRPKQKEAFTKLAHPRAKVWHQAEAKLTNPITGKPYAQ